VGTPYLGEIKAFSFQFAPKGWALCSGQLLSISQNAALFAILGTTFGGNGTTTFALPNLQSRLAVSFGQGNGLQNWTLGEFQGEQNHTVTINEVPLHTHQATASAGIAFNQQAAAPGATSFYGRERGGAYSATTDGSTLHPSVISTVGGSQPHNNSQPSLVLNYSVALVGIFPTRN
jgi:microcystin-dependent protein